MCSSNPAFLTSWMLASRAKLNPVRFSETRRLQVLGHVILICTGDQGMPIQNATLSKLLSFLAQQGKACRFGPRLSRLDQEIPGGACTKIPKASISSIWGFLKVDGVSGTCI